MSQEEAAKAGKAVMCSVRLQTVTPFPVGDSEGSACVLLAKQGTKPGFPMAETFP